MSDSASPLNNRRNRVRRVAIALIGLLGLLAFGAAWGAAALAGDDGMYDNWSPRGPRDITILGVRPGGPADRAGLKPGDVILAVDSAPPLQRSDSDVYGLHAGEHLVLPVRRTIPGTMVLGPPESADLVLTSPLALPGAVLSLVDYTVARLLGLAVGVGVAFARPTTPGARLLLAVSAFAALSFASGAWGTWGYAPGDLPVWIRRAVYLATLLVGVAGLHLCLSFPAPLPAVVRLRRIGGIGPPLDAVGLLLALGTALLLGDTLRLPYIVAGILLTLAVLALLHSYRRPATPLVRAQLRWIFWGSVPPVLCWVVASLLRDSDFIQLAVATYVLFILGIGIAVLRYHLYDIDVVIRRTLVYGVLTVGLGLIYYGSVVVFQQVLRLLTGHLSDVAIVGSTLVIAALFNPLRRAVQAFIDRRFYRRKYDSSQTLVAFSSAVRNEVDLTSLTEQLLAVVDETLQPSLVSLWLSPGVAPTTRATIAGTSTPKETPSPGAPFSNSSGGY